MRAKHYPAGVQAMRPSTYIHEDSGRTTFNVWDLLFLAQTNSLKQGVPDSINHIFSVIKLFTDRSKEFPSDIDGIHFGSMIEK